MMRSDIVRLSRTTPGQNTRNLNLMKAILDARNDLIIHGVAVHRTITTAAHIRIPIMHFRYPDPPPGPHILTLYLVSPSHPPSLPHTHGYDQFGVLLYSCVLAAFWLFMGSQCRFRCISSCLLSIVRVVHTEL